MDYPTDELIYRNSGTYEFVWTQLYKEKNCPEQVSNSQPLLPKSIAPPTCPTSLRCITNLVCGCLIWPNPNHIAK